MYLDTVFPQPGGHCARVLAKLLYRLSYKTPINKVVPQFYYRGGGDMDKTTDEDGNRKRIEKAAQIHGSLG